MALDLFEALRRMITLPASMNSVDDFLGAHPQAAAALKAITTTINVMVADAVTGAIHSIVTFSDTSLETAQNLIIQAVKGTLFGLDPALEAGIEAAVRSAVPALEALEQTKLAALGSDVVAAVAKALGTTP